MVRGLGGNNDPRKASIYSMEGSQQEGERLSSPEVAKVGDCFSNLVGFLLKASLQNNPIKNSILRHYQIVGSWGMHGAACIKTLRWVIKMALPLAKRQIALQGYIGNLSMFAAEQHGTPIEHGLLAAIQSSS